MNKGTNGGLWQLLQKRGWCFKNIGKGGDVKDIIASQECTQS